MWLNQRNDDQDEEMLLASPASTASSFSGFMLTPPARCKYRPRLMQSISRLTWSPLWHLFILTIPSFMRHAPESASNIGSEKHSHTVATKKPSTAYLDGVRGFASFIVFIFHFSHMMYPSTNTGYGVAPTPSIWQLPIIRFVYSGSAMVAIFFVVSGYVLTHRYIQKMHRREFETLYASLTSLAFRRALRLFLPALASCALSFVCASIGLLSVPRRINHRPFNHGFSALFHYIDLESNPWTWDLYMEGFYNPQLWSIALEYRGSMVVFLVVLGLARSRTSVRMAFELGMVIHAFLHRRWDIALFVAGMLVAELDVFVHNSTLLKTIMRTWIAKALLTTIMITGMWLSGFPRDHGFQSYGYGLLEGVSPQGSYSRRLWLAIAAIMIVGPMPYLPFIQALFNTSLSRYLGKISFALYLVHGLGNRTIGLWLLKSTRSVFGAEGYWANLISFVVSFAIYTPIIVWWSDMFWRAIDIPSANFAKWLEGICASSADNEEGLGI